jgi:hypothetical protein
MTQHFTGDLRAQLAEHLAGHSARSLPVAKIAGITRTLARTRQDDWKRERQLKNQGGASRRCPKAASGSASHQPSERNKQP